MILNEATFHLEIKNIAKDLYNEFHDNMPSNVRQINITDTFTKHLPAEIVNKIRDKNIKVFLEIVKTDNKEYSSTAYFNRKTPFLLFKLHGTKVLLPILRHEITHCIDMIRSYPKAPSTKEYEQKVSGGILDSKVKEFREKMRTGAYKTERSANVGFERNLGDLYHVYGKENIELNQRITEFVHKMQSSSFRTKMMNNMGYDNRINNYKELLYVIFDTMTSNKLYNDEKLKKYIISRLNRENVLKYINPEVFNRNVARTNKFYQNREEEDKIKTASKEMRRMKKIKTLSSEKEDMKQALADYRSKKGISQKYIPNKDVITKTNLENKIKNLTTKSNSGNDELDKLLAKRKADKAKADLRRFKKTIGEEVLEEGIRFFKTSDKLKKLVDNISSKLERIEEPEERRKIITLINKIDRLANKFEKIEIEYKVEKIMKNPTPMAKQHYAELTTEFANIVKLAKKEDMKTLLKNIGSYSLLFVAMTVPYQILNKINPIINPENSDVKRALSYIGMSLPIKFINSNKIVDKFIKTDVVADSAKHLEDKNV